MSNEKVDEGWKQFFTEEMMSEMNIIDENILGKVRMMLYIIYNPSYANIEYDFKNLALKVSIKFKWYQFIFKRKQVLREINQLLFDKFPNLTTIMVIEERS